MTLGSFHQLDSEGVIERLVKMKCSSIFTWTYSSRPSQFLVMVQMVQRRFGELNCTVSTCSVRGSKIGHENRTELRLH